MIDKRRVVPAELAWVDPTMRPLLQAMLQPLPENRPSSMAEVAAWEPPAPTAARALKAPAVASERSGRTPALIGALIAVLSLGGVAYVFRDDLARWAGTFSAPSLSAGPAEEAMNSPTTTLPPLTVATAAPARSFVGIAGGDKSAIAARSGNESARANQRPREWSLRRRRNPPVSRHDR